MKSYLNAAMWKCHTQRFRSWYPEQCCWEIGSAACRVVVDMERLDRNSWVLAYNLSSFLWLWPLSCFTQQLFPKFILPTLAVSRFSCCSSACCCGPSWCIGNQWRSSESIRVYLQAMIHISSTPHNPTRPSTLIVMICHFWKRWPFVKPHKIERCCLQIQQVGCEIISDKSRNTPVPPKIPR